MAAAGKMRIEIQGPDVIKASQAVNLRVVPFNDSYEPVSVSRNAFVGPNVRAVTPERHAYPESVEPTFGGQDEPLTLQPSARGFYNAHLQPLLDRVADSVNLGKSAGFTQSGAIDTLKGKIRWAESITAFNAADQAANNPMKTVDTNDLATGTYPVDAGAGTVGGAPFTHRLRLPSEPNPP